MLLFINLFETLLSTWDLGFSQYTPSCPALLGLLRGCKWRVPESIGSWYHFRLFYIESNSLLKNRVVKLRVRLFINLFETYVRLGFVRLRLKYSSHNTTNFGARTVRAAFPKQYHNAFGLVHIVFPLYFVWDHLQPMGPTFKVCSRDFFAFFNHCLRR